MIANSYPKIVAIYRFKFGSITVFLYFCVCRRIWRRTIPQKNHN